MNTPIIEIEKSDYQAKTKSFVFEISQKPLAILGERVKLRNPKTGNEVAFNHTHIDTDGEDVYGWNYVSEDSKYTLLIIND